MTGTNSSRKQDEKCECHQCLVFDVKLDIVTVFEATLYPMKGSSNYRVPVLLRKGEKKKGILCRLFFGVCKCVVWQYTQSIFISIISLFKSINFFLFVSFLQVYYSFCVECFHNTVIHRFYFSPRKILTSLIWLYSCGSLVFMETSNIFLQSWTRNGIFPYSFIFFLCWMLLLSQCCTLVQSLLSFHHDLDAVKFCFPVLLIMVFIFSLVIGTAISSITWNKYILRTKT